MVTFKPGDEVRFLPLHQPNPYSGHTAIVIRILSVGVRYTVYEVETDSGFRIVTTSDSLTYVEGPW